MLGNAFKKSAERFGIDVDKLLKSGASEAAGREAGGPAVDTSSSVTKVLVGSVGTLAEFYFPPELIGGCCPRVAGEEEDIVWNAAAEACDSERIHVVWKAVDDRIWYLAIRSSEMASHPGGWCPFASLLPGMKDSEPSPVCYTYFSDEAATMMTVTAEGLQIYRGMTSVVRAKAERTARELNDAKIVELIPDKIMALTPMPWYSVSLFEDRARRVFAVFAVAAALGIAALAFVIWLLATLVIISNRVTLHEAQERTASKTMDLMNQVSDLRISPVRETLAHFTDLNDGLLAVNGFLEVYEVKGTQPPRWRATVPPNVTADRINEMGGKTIETSANGVDIGNAAEIQYEASTEAKKR
jgi:hypothetical protein